MSAVPLARPPVQPAQEPLPQPAPATPHEPGQFWALPPQPLTSGTMAAAGAVLAAPPPETPHTPPPTAYLPAALANGAASRTATTSHAGVAGNADTGLMICVPGTRPCHARGLGNFPARHSAISRSSFVLIRPIRPQTATSNTVKARSRAATTAMAAWSLVRTAVKFNIGGHCLQASVMSIKITFWCNKSRHIHKLACANDVTTALHA